MNLLKKLFEKGVEYSGKNLIFAAQGTFHKSNKIDVVQYLIENLKIKPTFTSESGKNVLHYIVTMAVTNGAPETIKLLLDNGADINKDEL